MVRRGFWLKAMVVGGGLLPGFGRFTSQARAQLVFDGTLGRAGAAPKLAGNYTVAADRGRAAGGNLFHSFSQFSIPAGESATFSGPASVTNVLARVTGGT